jgi:outer membrane protein assembly factor BamB
VEESVATDRQELEEVAPAWAQARRSPRHTAYNAAESVITSTNVGRLHTVWEAAVGTDQLIYRDQQLFATTPVAGKGGVIALAAGTGGFIWSSQDPAGTFAGFPAYNHGVIYAKNEEASIGVRALNGDELYRGPFADAEFVTTNPLSAVDHVYQIGTGRSAPSSSDLVLRNTVLKTTVIEPLPFATHADPAAANERLFVTGEGETLALNATTGAVVWQASEGSDAFGPAVLAGRVFVPTDEEGGIAALDERTGAVLWSRATTEPIVGSVAVTETSVFVPMAVAGGGVRVQAFDVGTGANVFSTALGDSALSGELGIAADVGYLGQSNGHLYAFAVSTGAPLLDLNLGSGPVSAPAIADGHVFVASASRVFSLGLEDALGAPTADPNGPSRAARLSVDGRYVAYESYASNLVSGDTNQQPDIFVYDRQTHRNTRVNLTAAGAQATDRSFLADFTENGRYAAFRSWAQNLGAISESLPSLFVADVVSGSIEKANVDSAGVHITTSGSTSMSADGRVVVFDGVREEKLHVRDRSAGTTTTLDCAALGLTRIANGVVSGSGQRVLFSGSNALGNDDLYVYNVANSALQVVPLGSYAPEIYRVLTLSTERNARFVVFTAAAAEGAPHYVYVVDRVQGTIERVASSSGSQIWRTPSVTPDGRYVCVTSDNPSLVPNDTNAAPDVFLIDRQLGTTSRVSVSSSGGQTGPQYGARQGALSADGKLVAFTTDWKFATSDRNQRDDIYLRDIPAATTTRVSLGY